MENAIFTAHNIKGFLYPFKGTFFTHNTSSISNQVKSLFNQIWNDGFLLNILLFSQMRHDEIHQWSQNSSMEPRILTMKKFPSNIKQNPSIWSSSHFSKLLKFPTKESNNWVKSPRSLLLLLLLLLIRRGSNATHRRYSLSQISCGESSLLLLLLLIRWASRRCCRFLS